jgi:hypothetical protein
VLVNAKNLGLNPTLNRGLASARGEYLVFLDADDRMLPHMVATQVALLEADPRIALAYGDVTVVDRDDRVLEASLIASIGVRPPAPDAAFPLLLQRGNFIHISAATVRASAVVEVGGFDEHLAYQDYDLFLRLTRRHRARWTGEVDAEVVALDDSMSRRLGLDEYRTRLSIAGKWRTDPTVDGAALRHQAAGWVWRLAGGPGPLTWRSSATAVVEGTRRFGDPLLPAASGWLLARAAAGPVRRRICRRSTRTATSGRVSR